MQVKRTSIWSMGIALVCASSSFAQNVKTDYDRNADFSQYKTYSWGGVETEDPLWVDRIKAAVNSALAMKGWTQVDSGGDIAIMSLEMNKDHQTLNTYYDNFGGGFGGGWRWGGWGDQFGTATTTESTYTVGTLVVDLFDAKEKALVWRGSASDTLSNKSDKNIKNLEKGVAKMFEHFPPETRKNAANRPVSGSQEFAR
jgi:hypothetical protein